MASKNPAAQPAPGAGLVWNGVQLPRVPPGDYQATCVAWQGPQWVWSFRRWSLRLEFSLLSENVFVSGFYNLGSDKKAPQIGRKSRIFRAWCLANGEPPCKGQLMTWDTFLEPGLLYTVKVVDSTKDAEDAAKPEALVYSQVSDILTVDRP